MCTCFSFDQVWKIILNFVANNAQSDGIVSTNQYVNQIPQT